MKHTVILGSSLVIAVFACGVVPASANTSAGVDLAQLKGWDIVVADDAIASEKYAAEEFQEFFKQATGVKLPIVGKVNRLFHHRFANWLSINLLILFRVTG